MDLEKKEIDQLNNEKKLLENKNDIFKSKFADDILNGVGLEMKNALKNPIVLSKFDVFKIKLKVFFKKLIRNI